MLIDRERRLITYHKALEAEIRTGIVSTLAPGSPTRRNQNDSSGQPPRLPGGTMSWPAEKPAWRVIRNPAANAGRAGLSLIGTGFSGFGRGRNPGSGEPNRDRAE